MGKRRLELVLEAEASASDSEVRRESVAAVGVYTSFPSTAGLKVQSSAINSTRNFVRVALTMDRLSR